MSTAAHVVPPHDDDDGPSPSILENEVFNEPEARRERSRSPVPERAAASSSRRVVLQSLKPSVLLQDAPHVIPRTICPCRDVITLLVLGKARLQAMTKHQHPLLCAVELSSLHLWLIGFSRKNRLSVSAWTTAGSSKDFQAAMPLKGKELSDLLDAGHVPIPCKWVDTSKNIHEKHKPDYVPEFKSRLVSCGNLEMRKAYVPTPLVPT